MESLLLPCVATGVSLRAVWCLIGATPGGQPWTSAVTLPQGRNGLSARRMAVLDTFRALSLCRHVHHELLRSAALDLTPLIPATACHQRNYVERYSRFKGLTYVPRVIITDKLKSYGAAKREILPGVEHRQSRYLNNRCENSHRPTRQREYHMQGFKSPGHAQRFLSAYGPIAQHFRPRRHLLSASAYRDEMKNRFQSWAEVTGTERAA
jgi:DDE domain